MIKHFTLGAIGSLISAIFIILIFIIELFPSWTNLYFYPIYYGIALFLTILLFGVGILLASFGYREIRNNFGILSGKVGFVFGIISVVLILSSAIFEFLLSIYPAPDMYGISSLVRFLCLLVFGLTSLVWGITHYKVRSLCQIQKFSLITAGFFVGSGVVILSIFYIYTGVALSVVSLLFASIVFWNFRSNT